MLLSCFGVPSDEGERVVSTGKALMLFADFRTMPLLPKDTGSFILRGTVRRFGSSKAVIESPIGAAPLALTTLIAVSLSPSSGILAAAAAAAAAAFLPPSSSPRFRTFDAWSSVEGSGVEAMDIGERATIDDVTDESTETDPYRFLHASPLSFLAVSRRLESSPSLSSTTPFDMATKSRDDRSKSMSAESRWSLDPGFKERTQRGCSLRNPDSRDCRTRGGVRHWIGEGGSGASLRDEKSAFEGLG
mmetsp:Transcript_30134/g.55071  ORF Transcript_30134/g.55071 Transcript_30134/m.55071 type:complete len:246 (-) Transcript_30134:266-1003(-)